MSRLTISAARSRSGSVFAKRRSSWFSAVAVQRARLHQVHRHVGRAARQRPAERRLHLRVGGDVVGGDDRRRAMLWSVAATFTSTFGHDVGAQHLHLRAGSSDVVAVELRRVVDERHAEAGGRRAGHLGDLAVVGHGAAGAEAALQHHAVLQPGVDAEVHAVPGLGLLAEVAGETSCSCRPGPPCSGSGCRAR